MYKVHQFTEKYGLLYTCIVSILAESLLTLDARKSNIRIILKVVYRSITYDMNISGEKYS